MPLKQLLKPRLALKNPNDAGLAPPKPMLCSTSAWPPWFVTWIVSKAESGRKVREGPELVAMTGGGGGGGGGGGSITSSWMSISGFAGSFDRMTSSALEGAAAPAAGPTPREQLERGESAMPAKQ